MYGLRHLADGRAEALRRGAQWTGITTRIGPRGLEFARARVEMKAVETVLHLARQARRRMRHMVPAHVWKLVAPYGLTREASKPMRDSSSR